MPSRSPPSLLFTLPPVACPPHIEQISMPPKKKAKVGEPEYTTEDVSTAVALALKEVQNDDPEPLQPDANGEEPAGGEPTDGDPAQNGEATKKKRGRRRKRPHINSDVDVENYMGELEKLMALIRQDARDDAGLKFLQIAEEKLLNESEHYMKKRDEQNEKKGIKGKSTKGETTGKKRNKTGKAMQKVDWVEPPPDFVRPVMRCDKKECGRIQKPDKLRCLQIRGKWHVVCWPHKCKDGKKWSSYKPVTNAGEDPVPSFQQGEADKIRSKRVDDPTYRLNE